MTAESQQRLIEAAVAEAIRDPEFARALRQALDSAIPKRRRRRAQPVLDPFACYDAGGEAALRQALTALEINQLKDVIAHHQMDRARLAMKWQTPGRLIDLIITQTVSRTHKGKAFLR